MLRKNSGESISYPFAFGIEGLSNLFAAAREACAGGSREARVGGDRDEDAAADHQRDADRDDGGARGKTFISKSNVYHKSCQREGMHEIQIYYP